MSQARSVPIVTNNKSYVNSRELKNRGYPPWVGGIDIQIPSLSILPYSDESKIIYHSDVPEIFHVENCIEISVPENFTCSRLRENFLSCKPCGEVH